MKLAIIVGTRPEIIKMSPIIRECHKQGLTFFVTHTGQHYSFNLDKIFFKELELPPPKYKLEVGSGSHAEITGRSLVTIEEVLLKENPDIVLVEGDTNSVLAGALASVKLHIPVGHVEAGLRSYDRYMPEEINRVIVDHISNFLFAPTNVARKNLLKEGINEEEIYVTGNTIVDAVNQNLEIGKKKESILKRFNLEPKKFFLLTAHREENVDNKEKLQNILRGLELVTREFGFPIFFPIHPRTKRRIHEFGLELPEGVIEATPVGYFDFLELEANARLILTDSGGLQEEACILKVPCVTLRENTERPETVEIGANILVGTDPQHIHKGVVRMINKRGVWRNPLGDGQSGKRVLEILIEKFEHESKW